MRRREFITLLGSTAIWPRTARAQQAAIRRVAVVIPAFQDDQEWQLRLAAFVEVLSRSGWNDGRNVRLDVRWLGGEPARYEPVAVELTTGSPADVIVAISNPLAAQFKALTKTIPIVFISVSDPVSGGFVTNISRPGENITGFENFQPEMGGKWLGLLKEATNGLKRVGMLLQPESAHLAFERVIEAAARTLGVQTASLGVRNGAEIEHSIAAFAEQSDSGLIIFPYPLFTQNRDLIIVLAARHRLPAIYPFRYFAISGGLNVLRHRSGRTISRCRGLRRSYPQGGEAG